MAKLLFLALALILPFTSTSTSRGITCVMFFYTSAGLNFEPSIFFFPLKSQILLGKLSGGKCWHRSARVREWSDLSLISCAHLHLETSQLRNDSFNVDKTNREGQCDCALTVREKWLWDQRSNRAKPARWLVNDAVQPHAIFNDEKSNSERVRVKWVNKFTWYVATTSNLQCRVNYRGEFEKSE